MTSCRWPCANQPAERRKPFGSYALAIAGGLDQNRHRRSAARRDHHARQLLHFGGRRIGAPALDDDTFELDDRVRVGGCRQRHPGGAGQRNKRDQDGGAEDLQAVAVGGGADAVHGLCSRSMARSVFRGSPTILGFAIGCGFSRMSCGRRGRATLDARVRAASRVPSSPASASPVRGCRRTSARWAAASRRRQAFPAGRRSCSGPRHRAARSGHRRVCRSACPGWAS
mmetsp:Transcript_655/g.1397  ORF Transcript_655/g.1397 Transcript_655/m.1397 type:complete len:227 (-) Transcript_655:1236-1916(-)